MVYYMSEGGLYGNVLQIAKIGVFHSLDPSHYHFARHGSQLRFHLANSLLMYLMLS